VSERDGVRLRERRALTEGGRRVTKEVRIEPAGEDARTWHEDVRLYEPAELARLAETAGLAVQRFAGDFAGAPLVSRSPRQIAWLRRP
jgi:hypothetical protein